MTTPADLITGLRKARNQLEHALDTQPLEALAVTAAAGYALAHIDVAIAAMEPQEAK